MTQPVSTPSVGPYQIRAILHKGTPVVASAFDPRARRDITLKLYPHTESSLESQIEAIAARYNAALTLRHPAIVPAFEIGASERYVFVASAKGDGKRLTDLLTSGPLAARRAAVVARSLAEALSLAHERGFVHGQIHPDGILVDGAAAAWVDFGSSSAAGNPAYAAPERLGDPPGDADAASDQYGLGSVLFEMLCGKSPYEGDDDEIVADVLMAETAPRLKPINHAIDLNLEAICRKSLAPVPSDRYPSCSEFADDLRRWIDGEPVAARPPGFVRRKLMGAGVLLGALLLTLAGAAGLGFLAFSQRQAALAAAEDARMKQSALDAEQTSKLGAADLKGKDAATLQKALADLKAREKDLAAARSETERERVKYRNDEAKLKEEKTKLESEKNAEAKARTELEAAQYAALMVRSHRAWLDRDPVRARAALQSAKPANKRPDLRGWEWHYLERLYRPPKTFTLTGEPTQLAQLDSRSADGTDLRAAAFAYSQDGASLVMSLVDDKITIWNSLLGAKAAAWESHRNGICDVAFAPGGARISTASADKMLRVWQYPDGRVEQTLRGHDDAVLAAAWHPDGKKIASGSADRKIMIWDVESGEVGQTIEAHAGAVHSLAYDRTGKLLVSAGADGLIKVWNAADGKVKLTLSGHSGPVFSIAFSPEFDRIASAGADRTVRLWDATSGREIRSFAGHSRSVRSVAFHPDGQRLASGGEDQSVCIWDVTGNLVVSFPSGHTNRIHRIAYRSDGRQFATASLDQSLKLWDADRPIAAQSRALRGHDDAVAALAVSPDGKRIATGSADKTARLWDAVTGEEQRSLTGHTAAVRAAAFSADNAFLITGSDDGTARIWDAATGQFVRSVGGHAGAVNGVAFSPDGRLIATAGADGSVRLRETSSGQALYTFDGHRGGAIGVVFAPDGKRLLTTGADGGARFWSVESGEEVAGVIGRSDDFRLLGPPGALQRDGGAVAGGFAARAAYSPNGKRCAIIRKDGAVDLFDTALFTPVVRMEGHDSPIRALAFSPDNRRLATCDGDGVIKIWDCKSGLPVLSMTGHTGAANGIAFGRDGRLLYTAGADKIVRIWDGGPDDPNVKPHDPDDDYGADPTRPKLPQ